MFIRNVTTYSNVNLRELLQYLKSYSCVSGMRYVFILEQDINTSLSWRSRACISGINNELFENKSSYNYKS